MIEYEQWVQRFPEPRLAQIALLEESSEDLVLRGLASLATGERALGPYLRQAFLSICHGPQREPYLRVLGRAEKGRYPAAALRSLLLQSQGKRIYCKNLRRQIQNHLGVYPRAEIYLLPDRYYRAAAAEIGFPLAFYKPDTVYIQRDLPDSVLLHELLHSAQHQTSGSVRPAASERDRVALEVLEAITEEWVARNGGGSLYPDIRARLLSICPNLDIDSLVLLHPVQMLEILEQETGGRFLQLWKRPACQMSEILV